MAEEKKLLVDFFGSVSLPDNSHERAMNQLACHIFLMTSVLVNVAYLIFVAGLGTGSLKKNFLQQLALMGALMQIGSCGNSITRYNIGDEYNFKIANMGAAFGLASGIFNNIALSTIWFHKDPNRKRNWFIMSVIIILLSVWAMTMELKTYDKTHFFYFRIVNILNIPYTMICCFFTYRALKSGKITISKGTNSTEAVTNLFLVLTLFELLWFLANVSGMTIFIYIGGGLTFMTVNVATHFMGNFDDYYIYSGEQTPKKFLQTPLLR